MSWGFVRSEPKQISFPDADPESYICRVVESQDSCHIPRAIIFPAENQLAAEIAQGSRDNFLLRKMTVDQGGRGPRTPRSPRSLESQHHPRLSHLHLVQGLPSPHPPE